MGPLFVFLGISVAVVAAVLVVAVPLLRSSDPSALFLRFAEAAGIAAVGASILYIAYEHGGGQPCLAVGDTCMVLVPFLLFVAVHALGGGRVLWPSVAAFVVSIGVGVVTSLVPLPGSLGVKVAVLTIASGMCAWAAARSPAEPWGPIRTIALAAGGYGVFSALRLGFAIVTGWGSPPYRIGFSFVPATVVGSVVVLAVGVAVLQLRTERSRNGQPSSRPVSGSIVVVGDWRLASAAYGADRVRALVSDLRSVGRSVDPAAADVPRGVEVSVPQAVAVLSDRLRATRGWSEDEIALLADGAATAALRTHPVGPRAWSWVRSRRT